MLLPSLLFFLKMLQMNAEQKVSEQAGEGEEQRCGGGTRKRGWGGGEGGRRFMGEEAETGTANIHRTASTGLSNTVNAQLGQTFAAARRKTGIKRGDKGKGENLEALTTSCFLLPPITSRCLSKLSTVSFLIARWKTVYRENYSAEAATPGRKNRAQYHTRMEKFDFFKCYLKWNCHIVF